MPRKKASRAPSRAKPTLPDDSIVMPDMETEERKKKLELLLKDFDVQVAERVAEMEKEMQAIQESIQNIYKRDLARYPEATRKMLWSDYIKQDKESKVKVRTSVDDLLNSADFILTTTKTKKGPGKSNNKIDSTVPSSASKSTRSNRQKNVLGSSQLENMLPPLSTARAPRTRKMNLEVSATPSGQGIPSTFTSMIVTPKFDPRTPLPPGTIKRKPKLGEIAISLTGSPLQVSPKGWFSTLSTDDVDEKTREELKIFHERVGKLLNI
ncbi:borealin-like [Palaemon carinicauda]|uniref:borealin-like n=1 Tax=Palaemon carinicauda TaxID=392227 RepID=UPI0035B5EA6D